MEHALKKDAYLTQDGNGQYFDVRLTLEEAIAIVDAVGLVKNLMVQLEMNPEKELTNPTFLNMATEKIFRGYVITTKDKSNSLA